MAAPGDCRLIRNMDEQTTPFLSSHVCLLAQQKSIGVTLWLVWPESTLELQWPVAEVESSAVSLMPQAGMRVMRGHRTLIWCPQGVATPPRLSSVYPGVPLPEQKLTGGKGWGGSQDCRVLWWKTDRVSMQGFQLTIRHVVPFNKTPL